MSISVKHLKQATLIFSADPGIFVALIFFSDEYSREQSVFVSSIEGAEHPIEPISDIGVNHINDRMFGQPS